MRRIRMVGHVARMAEIRIAYRIMDGNLNGRGHSEGLRVGEGIILKWIFRK
jgi:hypothetical protein